MVARNLKPPMGLYYDKELQEPVGDLIDVEPFAPDIGGEYILYLHNASNKRAKVKDTIQQNDRVQITLADKINPHETVPIRIIIAGIDDPIDADDSRFFDDVKLPLKIEVIWEDTSI